MRRHFTVHQISPASGAERGRVFTPFPCGLMFTHISSPLAGPQGEVLSRGRGGIGLSIEVSELWVVLVKLPLSKIKGGRAWAEKGGVISPEAA
jgi:hypothetical protein